MARKTVLGGLKNVAHPFTFYNACHFEDSNPRKDHYWRLQTSIVFASMLSRQEKADEIREELSIKGKLGGMGSEINKRSGIKGNRIRPEKYAETRDKNFYQITIGILPYGEGKMDNQEAWLTRGWRYVTIKYRLNAKSWVVVEFSEGAEIIIFRLRVRKKPPSI